MILNLIATLGIMACLMIKRREYPMNFYLLGAFVNIKFYLKLIFDLNINLTVIKRPSFNRFLLEQLVIKTKN